MKVRDLADEVSVDNLGNVIAILRRAKITVTIKKSWWLPIWMKLGLLCTHIDDKGFLRFHPLGGFDPKTLTAQRVIIHGKKDLVGVMGSKTSPCDDPGRKNQASQNTYRLFH